MSEKVKAILMLIAGTLSSMCLAGATAIQAGATWHDLAQPAPMLMMIGTGASSVMLWITKGYRALVEKENRNA